MWAVLHFFKAAVAALKSLAEYKNNCYNDLEELILGSLGVILAASGSWHTTCQA
jgi:hypothetical protein